MMVTTARRKIRLSGNSLDFYGSGIRVTIWPEFPGAARRGQVARRFGFEVV